MFLSSSPPPADSSPRDEQEWLTATARHCEGQSAETVEAELSAQIDAALAGWRLRDAILWRRLRLRLTRARSEPPRGTQLAS